MTLDFRLPNLPAVLTRAFLSVNSRYSGRLALTKRDGCVWGTYVCVCEGWGPLKRPRCWSKSLQLFLRKFGLAQLEESPYFLSLFYI